MQIYFDVMKFVETISHKMEINLKVLPFELRCVIITTARKNENAFSGKDELMGNLKTAALACGVVASVLAGGFGVGYITSSTISKVDLISEENKGVTYYDSAVDSASVNSTADETDNATANKGTTTKKSNMADDLTAASKKIGSVQEGTSSQYSSAAADNAAKISKSVPAPAHAPAAITQPVTQPATTASILADVADVVTETTAALAAMTSTTTQATTTTTTSETTTTTTTTTTTVSNTAETTTTTVEAVPEAPEETTETYVEPETEPVAIDVEADNDRLPISDEDYILLCNAVANEAGSNWISDYNKALVVEVIMNRVNSPKFSNTVYGVLTEPNQFTGAWNYVTLTTFSSGVTQSVKDAVILYFKEPESFTQGYLGFWGDGYSNHFY